MYISSNISFLYTDRSSLISFVSRKDMDNKVNKLPRRRVKI